MVPKNGSVLHGKRSRFLSSSLVSPHEQIKRTSNSRRTANNCTRARIRVRVRGRVRLFNSLRNVIFHGLSTIVYPMLV